MNNEWWCVVDKHLLLDEKQELSIELNNVLGCEPLTTSTRIAWLMHASRLCERLAFICSQLVTIRSNELRDKVTRTYEAKNNGRPLSPLKQREAHVDATLVVDRDRAIKDYIGGNQMYYNWANMYGTLAQAEMSYASFRAMSSTSVTDSNG